MKSTQDPLNVTPEQDPLRGMWMATASDTSMSTIENSSTTGNTRKRYGDGAMNGHSASMNNNNYTHSVDDEPVVGGTGGEDNFFSGGGAKEETETATETSVMGGLSGSIQYSNTNSERQYTDPGLIISGNRRRANANSNSDANSNNTGANTVGNQRASLSRNIVINAESTSEGRTSTTSDEKNVFQSFMSQVRESTTAININMNNNTSKKKKPIKIALTDQVKLQHEDHKRRYQGQPGKDSKHYNITPEPCVAKFLVTKVRNWRAGYSRILSLHKTYFTTLDPDSHEITNLWHYSHVKQYMASPSTSTSTPMSMSMSTSTSSSSSSQERDCIMVDVVEDSKGLVKLKFKCCPGEKSRVMTAFAEYIAITNGLYKRLSQGQYPMFMKCQRLTRNNARIDSALV